MSSPLSTPLPLRCGLTLPNRLVKAAMTETMADPATNRPNQLHYDLYHRWTIGGIGTQITGNVMIDRRYMEAPGNIALEACDESPEHFLFYRQYAAAIKSNPSTIAIMQLSHAGRQCPMAVNFHGLAPSPVKLALPGVPLLLTPVGTPKEMSLDDIREVIQRFTTSARLAVEAGFDGVQIHSAHGYLLSSFLSPRVNQRTDDYGGTKENRRRLLLEICTSVRQAIGSNKILAVKLNSADFQKGGFTEEESLEVIQELDKLKIDFIEISGGTYENSTMMKSKSAFERDIAQDSVYASSSSSSSSQPPVRESTRRREAYFLNFCIAARRIVPHFIFMCSGGFRSGIAMNRVIDQGEVDLIGLARPLCVMPDFPRLLLSADQLQSNNLKNAVEDVITVPTYSLAVSTPFASLNRTIEASLENFFHQACMRRLAKGEEPNISKDLSTSAISYYMTITFFKTYIFEPKRNKKLAFMIVSLGVSGLAVLLAMKIRQPTNSSVISSSSSSSSSYLSSSSSILSNGRAWVNTVNDMMTGWWAQVTK